MAAELPGIYIDADNNKVWTLDHVKAAIRMTGKQKMLTVNNPTDYEAVVKVAIAINNANALPIYQTIILQPKETKKWKIQKDGKLVFKAFDK